MNFFYKTGVNVLACLFLAFLLFLPTVASFGLFKYEPTTTWKNFEITNQRSHFVNYLDLKLEKKDENLFFDVDIAKFSQKDAFYKNVIAIKNKTAGSKNILITDVSGGVEVYFAKSDEKSGPSQISIDTDQVVFVNILAPKSLDQNTEVQKVTFILKE